MTPYSTAMIPLTPSTHINGLLNKASGPNQIYSVSELQAISLGACRGDALSKPTVRGNKKPRHSKCKTFRPRLVKIQVRGDLKAQEALKLQNLRSLFSAFRAGMSHLRDALLEYPTPRFFTWLLMTSSTMWEVLSSNAVKSPAPAAQTPPEKSKARTSYGMEGLCNRRTSGLALKCAEMCRKQHTNDPKRWIETFGKPAFCLSVT